MCKSHICICVDTPCTHSAWPCKVLYVSIGHPQNLNVYALEDKERHCTYILAEDTDGQAPTDCLSLLPVVEEAPPWAEEAASTDGPVVEWRGRLVPEIDVGRKGLAEGGADGLGVDEGLRAGGTDWLAAAVGGARGAGSGADVEASGFPVADAAGGHEDLLGLDLVAADGEHPPVHILLPAHGPDLRWQWGLELTSRALVYALLDSERLFHILLVEHEDPLVAGGLGSLGEDQRLLRLAHGRLRGPHTRRQWACAEFHQVVIQKVFKQGIFHDRVDTGISQQELDMLFQIIIVVGVLETGGVDILPQPHRAPRRRIGGPQFPREHWLEPAGGFDRRSAVGWVVWEEYQVLTGSGPRRQRHHQEL